MGGARIPEDFYQVGSRAVFAALAGIAGALVALCVAIFAYALGSFLLMAAHTPRRSFGTTARHLARELAVALWTQPLLPLFYLLGRRMDRFLLARAREGIAREAAERAPVVPVVFVHGYMQNRVSFLGIARALAQRNIGPLYGFNYPWFASLEANAARLDRFIARVCEETGAKWVDLVCHSMGGVVAMEMMRDEARKDSLKVRKCVTIASPHAGIVWKGPLLGAGAVNLRRGSKLLDAHAGHMLTVPTLSVYSTHDNIVHPHATSSLAKRGGRDVVVEGLGHLAIMYSPEVANHVASFLAEPV